MDVDVVRPDIDAVEAAVVTASDEHVVDLAVRARVHAEVEGGAIDEFYVVDAEAVLLQYH